MNIISDSKSLRNIYALDRITRVMVQIIGYCGREAREQYGEEFTSLVGSKKMLEPVMAQFYVRVITDPNQGLLQIADESELEIVNHVLSLLQRSVLGDEPDGFEWHGVPPELGLIGAGKLSPIRRVVSAMTNEYLDYRRVAGLLYEVYRDRSMHEEPRPPRSALSYYEPIAEWLTGLLLEALRETK